MAIGDYGNGNSNNNQKNTETTYYSRMRFRTKDNKRMLSCSFWSGLMILSIDDVDINNGFKPNQLELIRLSANKAKILYMELKALKEYINNSKTIDPNKAFGVSAGLGNETPYIGFSVKEDDDLNRILCVTIGKINNNGDILSAQTMVFDNHEYTCGLEWNDISHMDVVSVQYTNIELDIIMDALYAFSTNMNGALAYSIYDLGRYDANRTNKKFDAIFDKLGIEKIGSNRSYGSSGGNSFLNNLSAKNSTPTSLDELGELLDD